MVEYIIGVDESKSHLDVFRLEDRGAHRLENSAAGFPALRRWLGKDPVARIVFEPPEPLDEDIFEKPAFAVHRDTPAGSAQPVGPGKRRELASLNAVLYSSEKEEL